MDPQSKKKVTLGLLTGALLLATIFAGRSHAVLYVPDFGETGWQTYAVTLDTDFSGIVGIGVSNLLDTALDSVLLIDNLVGMGPAGNEGFELGDFTGYTVYGTATVDSSATAWGGTPYGPTEGSFMAVLTAEGASTSFLPEFGATDGAYIEFNVDLQTGDTVSFDWNFLAMDYTPFEDFAFLYAKDEQGALVYYEKLAQISPIPEPSAILLLGAGLAGLGLWGRRRLSG